MNHSPRRGIAIIGLVVLAGTANAAAPTIDTSARNAIVLDVNTGTVLLDKGGDQRIPPASMSKMMTAYVVFDYLKRGQATMNDMLPVSEAAWAKHKTNESNMFVALGSRVKIEDLVRGMIIQSGNDACVVLAEGLAGSQQAFVEQMNVMAQKIGLTGTHYANVDGLPDPGEYTTPHDLARIATHLITDFPEHYGYESEKDFTYNGIKQGNRNPLLYKNIGVDGLKTGHTEEAGYGLTVSALRDGRRVIVVLERHVHHEGALLGKREGAGMGLSRVQRLPPRQGRRSCRPGAGMARRGHQGAGDDGKGPLRDPAAHRPPRHEGDGGL